MKVKVEYLGHIKNMINLKRHEIVELKEKSSIENLLMFLSEKYGDKFKEVIYEKGDKKVKASYMLTINGYLLNQLKGLETILKSDDHIILMPIVNGG